MEKEKILEASRNENKKKDLADIEVENTGVKFAAIATIILVTVYYALEIFIKGTTNYGLYSIIGLYCAVLFGFKAIKTKKTLYIFTSIIWLIVAILGGISYISNLFNTSTIL